MSIPFSTKENKVLISTLPRAKIDISGSDIQSRNINITYNSDEIVNFYLKLRGKPNKNLSQNIIEELKLLKEEVNKIINIYNGNTTNIFVNNLKEFQKTKSNKIS